MPVSSEKWHPWRIIAFVAIGLMLYAALYAWSDRISRAYGAGNPFYRILAAPAHSDWVVLGASHALPFGFGDMPDQIAAQTGKTVLPLAVTGGGPLTWRLIAERYFADHSAEAVLIVLDDFGFADRRWNAGRMADADVLGKIPADWQTVKVFAKATPHTLPVTVFASYATGFARINDQTRFQPDRWEAEDKFETSPRPSNAADTARIGFLYPAPMSWQAVDEGLNNLRSVIALALTNGARVVVIRPPLPDRFRAALPSIAGFEPQLMAVLADHNVAFYDFSQAIPETRYYFDTDHLNRAGVQRFLDEALAAVLQGDAGRDQ
jgi:hypothetical protein